jgi:hypothetical protein
MLGTCHEVASFFVSFVDLSEDTSQKEQQMTRRRRLPRGMYFANINVICFDVCFDVFCDVYFVVCFEVCFNVCFNVCFEVS